MRLVVPVEFSRPIGWVGRGGWACAVVLLEVQEPTMKEKNLLKFPVSITGKAGKATRTLVAGAAFAVAAGGFGVSAAYAATVEGPRLLLPPSRLRTASTV